jgi:hypothetical protein
LGLCEVHSSAMVSNMRSTEVIMPHSDAGVKVSFRLGNVKGFDGLMAAVSDSDGPVLKISANLPKFGSALRPMSNLHNGSAHAGFYLPLT